MNATSGRYVRLTMIGPMPPPTDGQSVVMTHLASAMAPFFPKMRVANISEGATSGSLRRFNRLRRSVAAWWSIRGSDAVYIAVKADHGMWLTTATAGLARLGGARIFLHHHSYSYIRERKRRMVALTRMAGPKAHHIVLTDSMARDLQAVMPEIHSLLVIGNAGLVDKSLLDLPLKSDGSELVLGHLSNLYLEKGLAEVVDLATALHKAGTRIRLLVGGPIVHVGARPHLDRAAQELGDLFEYRGPLSGEAKRAFFDEITHFIFPSHYIHESVPLVLYEAMAAGAVCVTTRRGSISEQLKGTESLIAENQNSFVRETLPSLVGAATSSARSQESKLAYIDAVSKSDAQLADFIALVSASL